MTAKDALKAEYALATDYATMAKEALEAEKTKRDTRERYLNELASVAYGGA